MKEIESELVKPSPPQWIAIAQSVPKPKLRQWKIVDWATTGGLLLCAGIMLATWGNSSPVTKERLANPLTAQQFNPELALSGQTSNLQAIEANYQSFRDEEAQRVVIGLAQQFRAIAISHANDSTNPCSTVEQCLNSYEPNRVEQVRQSFKVHESTTQVNVKDYLFAVTQIDALHLARILDDPVKTSEDMFFLQRNYPVLFGDNGKLRSLDDTKLRPNLLITQANQVEQAKKDLKALDAETQAEVLIELQQ